MERPSEAHDIQRPIRCVQRQQVMRCKNHNGAAKANFGTLTQSSLKHPVFYVAPTANTSDSFHRSRAHPAIC